MSSSINTNIAALSAQANIANASNSASASIARLSSGNRIVKSSDDVAGLAVGTSLKTQVTSLKAALNNASQGTSLLQVADGALTQIDDILQRQKAIASQAGSGSLTDTDRGFLDQEFQALTQQIDQIAGTTSFNGVNLLSGGLGTSTVLAKDPTAAANYDPSTADQSDAGGAAVASTSPIQAFDNTGADNSGTGSLGDLDITDSSGTLLTGSYDSVNSALIGQFSSFQYSNIIYGTSATLTATINGVQFTGSVSDGDGTALLHNGSTYINLGLGTGGVALTDATTAQNSIAKISDGFKNTYIERTSTVTGANFDGTRLYGATGSTTTGLASTRLYSANANISDFAYAGNSGGTDANILSVKVNGQTFTATGVKDALAGGVINFASTDGQTLVVDLTGFDSATGNSAFTNISTNASERDSLVNALNQGFSRAGSGLNFAVGATADANVSVSLQSVSSANLFNGQSLSVSTAAGAAAASAALDGALNTVSTVQSTVGALESRFNFISANLQTSIQNQDAASGSLLDTDVAAESTAYATSQVQLQAGIAVLAQANQLPQNLLKLIS